MKKKKITAILISMAIFSIALFNLLFFNIPRLHYTYDSSRDGYIVDKAYGDRKSYVVKENIKGCKVIGIGERAFLGHERLEAITFTAPENITYIGKLSFSECRRLKSIDLSSVAEIERNAFSYDASLTEVTLSAKNIGASAFYHCDSLSEVTLSEGLITIGSMAFSECGALHTLTLPKSTENVYADAFYNTSFTELFVPEHLKTDKYLSQIPNVVYYA